VCSWSPGWGHPQAPEYRGKLRNPLTTEFVQPVEDPRLKALQDHVVRVLNLAIHVGVCHDGPIDADVVVIIESEEFFRGELCVVVCDDGVRDSKAVDNVEEKLHGFLGFDHRDRPSLYPFDELVHGDKQVRVAPGRSFEGSDQIKPLDHERPCDRGCLECLGR